MLRLTLAGTDTLVTTPLCAACHHSPAGCCAAPPRVALADLARIVLRGGRDFLLAELRAGRLLPGPGNMWLVLPRRPHPSGVLACGYLGPSGCVLPPDRRSSTCNIYICDEALARDDDPATASRTRTVRDDLETELAHLDAELAARAAAHFPSGPPLDAPFLDWLGDTFRTLPPKR